MANGDKCRKINAMMRKKLKSEVLRSVTNALVLNVKVQTKLVQLKHGLNVAKSVAADFIGKESVNLECQEYSNR